MGEKEDVDVSDFCEERRVGFGLTFARLLALLRTVSAASPSSEEESNKFGVLLAPVVSEATTGNVCKKIKTINLVCFLHFSAKIPSHIFIPPLSEGDWIE